MKTYLYGIIRLNGSNIPEEFVTDDEKISFLQYNDIAAVLSEISYERMEELPKAILAKRLLHHQIVIERIMAMGFSILPIKLWTILEETCDTKCVLKNGYEFFINQLEEIESFIEFDIIATWNNFGDIIEKISKHKEIRDEKARILKEKGGISKEDSILIGKMLQEEIKKENDSVTKKIISELHSVVIRNRHNPVMNDQMLMNLACMIKQNENDSLMNLIEEIDRKYNGEIDFRCITPLPLYSFSTITINVLKEEEISWAKEKLGITNDLNKEILRKAFLRAAKETHPDNGIDEIPNSEFSEVKKAYSLLDGLCNDNSRSGSYEENNHKYYSINKV